MTLFTSPRWHLAALGIAVFCRVAAITSVTVSTLAQLLGDYSAYDRQTLAAWLLLSTVPAVVMIPVMGALARARWNRHVMLIGGAIAVGLLAIGNFGSGVPWLSVIGILNLEFAFFLSAALTASVTLAKPARISQQRTIGLGCLCAIAGAILAIYLEWSAWHSGFAAALWFAAFSLLGTWFVKHAFDEPTMLTSGIVSPYLTGIRAACQRRNAYLPLFGLWVWGVVGILVFVVILRTEWPREYDRWQHRLSQRGTWIEGMDLDPRWVLLQTFRILIAIAVGVCCTVLNGHAYRVAGFFFYSALGIVISSVCLLGGAWNSAVLGLGFSLGLSIVGLIHFLFAWTEPKHHGVMSGQVVGGWYVGALIVGLGIWKGSAIATEVQSPAVTVILVVTAISAVVALIAFARATVELTLEVLLWPIYRVHAKGQGVNEFPTLGPCLIIANHAAWFDPLFMVKAIPIPVTPMMSSTFFDLPFVSWMMRNVYGTIRVPDVGYRREAPELKDAVDTLNRGDSVLLFPEGYLRRREEIPLRRFGRGVWQILHDRPNTPVFACWIEGAWGCYVSFKGGLPTKGKRLDFWRSIRIGIRKPILLDPAMLQDQMKTRLFLMNEVSEARREIGLEPLDLNQPHDGDEE